MQDTCRTAEVEDLIAELERSNDALKDANDDLKKDIQKIRDDYQVRNLTYILEPLLTYTRDCVRVPLGLQQLLALIEP